MSRLIVTVREYTDGELARETITDYEDGPVEAEPAPGPDPAAWMEAFTWWRALVP